MTVKLMKEIYACGSLDDVDRGETTIHFAVAKPLARKQVGEHDWQIRIRIIDDLDISHSTLARLHRRAFGARVQRPPSEAQVPFAPFRTGSRVFGRVLPKVGVRADSFAVEFRLDGEVKAYPQRVPAYFTHWVPRIFGASACRLTTIHRVNAMSVIQECESHLEHPGLSAGLCAVIFFGFVRIWRVKSFSDRFG